jgi:hypothetical protein
MRALLPSTNGAEKGPAPASPVLMPTPATRNPENAPTTKWGYPTQIHSRIGPANPRLPSDIYTPFSQTIFPLSIGFLVISPSQTVSHHSPPLMMIGIPMHACEFQIQNIIRSTHSKITHLRGNTAQQFREPPDQSHTQRVEAPAGLLFLVLFLKRTTSIVGSVLFFLKKEPKTVALRGLQFVDAVFFFFFKELPSSGLCCSF